MSVIGWNEQTPSDGSAVGSDTPTIKSHWTALGTWLGVARYWPGSGGGSQASMGELKPGGVLAFFGPKSASSNTIGWYHLARGFVDSGTTRLYVYESNGTYLGATPFTVLHRLAGAGGNVVRSGSTTIASAGTPKTVSVPFPQTFDTATFPFVMCTLSSLSFVGGSPSTTSEGGFTSIFSYFGPAQQSLFTLYWTAFGNDSSGSL